MDSWIKWAADNKEGLQALAAFIAPLVAASAVLVAANISSRAARMAPGIQKEIGERQLLISREQLEFQRKQAAATLFGTYNQRWIDELRKLSSSLLGNLATLTHITSQHAKFSSDDPERDKTTAAFQESTFRHNALLCEIELMIYKNENYATIYKAIAAMYLNATDVNIMEFSKARLRFMEATEKVLSDKRKEVEAYLLSSGTTGLG